ncbi:MAG TPA: dihydrolipoamide acetyltransferase family protein [Cytophagaceae bacterium]|jgi:2-oxoglutarate dehydrogenase E2 component (dihydrolipoamide succinyltransferase)|nr:dihydrolipoamide acetyltransferase family protein [Cytophagaceae bacterium]
MALVEMIMPKMGESIMEGTILNWLKKVGDHIERDESVLEVATDKVDTDVPATHTGVLKQILAEKGQVVPVGVSIAIIDTGGTEEVKIPYVPVSSEISKETIEKKETTTEKQSVVSSIGKPLSGRFYSPLVLNIARQENISMTELDTIPGTGKESRVTKIDIFNFIENKQKQPVPTENKTSDSKETKEKPLEKENTPLHSVKPASSLNGNVEIIEMDRMRKMIAERMVESKRISPHVTSFVEADVTNIVYWRNRMKQDFMEKENAALTLTPIFIEAVVRAIKDYPMINISVEGDTILLKKEVNIGIAVALQNGNLIVPVVKNADQLNLIGLTKQVNDLARRARANKLTPDDLSGGTYTVSNVGSFGNVMGTPIIVQPQCAILALGAVVKKPAVIETPHGDTIGIRHMMFLSHSYDHRVIDGSLGGMFVRRVADYLEAFDLNRKVFS